MSAVTVMGLGAGEGDEDGVGDGDGVGEGEGEGVGVGITFGSVVGGFWDDIAKKPIARADKVTIDTTRMMFL
jgi:hypothetical protein